MTFTTTRIEGKELWAHVTDLIQQAFSAFDRDKIAALMALTGWKSHDGGVITAEDINIALIDIKLDAMEHYKNCPDDEEPYITKAWGFTAVFIPLKYGDAKAEELSAEINLDIVERLSRII